MLDLVRPYWLVVVLGLSSLVEARSLPSRILHAHGGGHGHAGGSMHSGGPTGGVPGGFLASGIVNHPNYSSGYGNGSSGYGYSNRYGHSYGLGGYVIGNYGYGYGGLGYGVGYPLAYNNGGGAPLLWPVLAPNFGNGGGMGGGGLMLPMPPNAMANANGGAAAAPRARNTNRAKELVEIGDRSFRGGNIKRADEKYHLAAKADPSSPIPHVHMAQVSLARGDYLAAADHLRDAITVSGAADWLLTTPDIQAIYGEPADFAKHLARLETHLQANPNDRDAWFVLGAVSYLSGRTKQASDVFQRLTDRKPDEALAAFMDASKTKLPPAAN